jgi:flagellin
MGLRINTNVASIGAQRNLSITNRRMNDSMRKLSSGQRITRAADDAAGLAISEKLKAQIRGLRQAKRNADDGISFIQTGEGALNEISSLIIRLRELSVQASSDTVGATERKFSNVEFQQLKDEIERISQSTEFNGTKLLDGTGGMVDFQIGIHNDARRDRISLDATSFMSDLGSLGIVSDDISAKEGAQMSLSRLDDALVKVNSMRADYGAMQNRLTSVTNTLAINDENLSAANSRIRDVDVAAETAELTRNNILVQAGTSVLAQANQSSQFALKLLG